MREYDENHAYEEVREDFIKEYKAQLERRGNGEKLEIVAEGTPLNPLHTKGMDLYYVPVSLWNWCTEIAIFLPFERLMRPYLLSWRFRMRQNGYPRSGWNNWNM